MKTELNRKEQQTIIEIERFCKQCNASFEETYSAWLIQLKPANVEIRISKNPFIADVSWSSSSSILMNRLNEFARHKDAIANVAHILKLIDFMFYNKSFGD